MHRRYPDYYYQEMVTEDGTFYLPKRAVWRMVDTMVRLRMGRVDWV